MKIARITGKLLQEKVKSVILKIYALKRIIWEEHL